MKTIGIIPARMESARLPKKPLADICGIPMIAHVYIRSKMAKNLDDLFIATDSLEIKDVIESIGGKVIMTSSEHQTGTDRIAEAASKIDCDIVVNIQGDEALLQPEHIEQIVEEFPKTMNDCPVGMMMTKFNKFNSDSDIKVVVNKKNEIMYFSRADIPSTARVQHDNLMKAYHIVPFSKDFLIKFSQMEQSPLEKIEYIEYLRVLENGYKIKMFEVDECEVSVDTPEDLAYVSKKMENDPLFQFYREKYSNLINS